MPIKLPRIKYNVKERGRRFLGQDRDFDVAKLCKSINGGACQEQVKNRAMFGYFGHALRKLVGMDIPESALISGKYQEVEPAVVTTYLKAYPNGDIEHESEFLDTESGQRAAKMYASKVGGFSSAIIADNYKFCGFDWVLNPNFNDNRPYILDSVDDLILDDVRLEIANENAVFFEQLAKNKDAELSELKVLLDHVNESLEFISGDRDRLIDLLAQGSRKSGAIILDDSNSNGFSLPFLGSTNEAERIKRDSQDFLDAVLLGIPKDELDDVKAHKKAIKAIAKSLKRYRD